MFCVRIYKQSILKPLSTYRQTGQPLLLHTLQPIAFLFRLIFRQILCSDKTREPLLDVCSGVGGMTAILIAPEVMSNCCYLSYGVRIASYLSCERCIEFGLLELIC